MKSSALLILCLSLTGCGLFRGGNPSVQQPEEEQKPETRFIGQITSVHGTQNFVLIRCNPGVTLTAGTILISISQDGSAANLRVSGEIMGMMAAADIQSGNPQVGDSVRELLLGAAEPEPETQALPEAEPEAPADDSPGGDTAVKDP